MCVCVGGGARGANRRISVSKIKRTLKFQANQPCVKSDVFFVGNELFSQKSVFGLGGGAGPLEIQIHTYESLKHRYRLTPFQVILFSKSILKFGRNQSQNPITSTHIYCPAYSLIPFSFVFGTLIIVFCYFELSIIMTSSSSVPYCDNLKLLFSWNSNDIHTY